MEKDVQKSIAFLKNKNNAKLAIVLGSGLSSLTDHVNNKQIINYHDIPGFLISTAPTHKGELIFGEINKIPVVLLNGRFHYYEGYSPQEITRYLKVLKQIGIKSLLLTNATGSSSKNFKPGDLVAITDHINLAGINPLRGKNDNSEGPRFTSLTNCYNPKNIKTLQAIAEELKIPLKTSIYAYTLGPSFETAAEIKMFHNLGADIVGMSTVPEVIMARYCDIDVAAISCVTNYGTGITGQPLTLEEVTETTHKYQNNFCNLVLAYVKVKGQEIN